MAAAETWLKSIMAQQLASAAKSTKKHQRGENENQRSESGVSAGRISAK